MIMQLDSFAHATAQELGLSMLEHDPLFDRIAPGAATALVASALEHGRRCAQAAVLKWGNDPRVIAARLAVPIIESESDGGYGSTIVFAEYTERPLRVTLYKAAIAHLNRRLEDDDIGRSIGIRDCEPVFLAHELYHHLDRMDNRHSLRRCHRVTLFQFGRWRWTSGLSSLEEIAAGAFAQTLLRLPVHPKMLDLVCITDARNRADRESVREAT